MNLGFERLNEIMDGLIGDEVQVFLTSGDDLIGKLKEICSDALILEDNSGKAAVLSASCIAAVLQGPFPKEEDIVITEPNKGVTMGSTARSRATKGRPVDRSLRDSEENRGYSE